MAVSQELAILTARAQEAGLQADELRQKADERQGSILRPVGAQGPEDGRGAVGGGR